MKIRFSKIEAGHYVALDEQGNALGYAVLTGTHLDDYPWDWYLTVSPASGKSRTTGVSDTLKSAKGQIRYALGAEED